MAMRVSDAGRKFITLREGRILKGYYDSKHLLTIGVGHLVKLGEPYKYNKAITAAECDRLLAQDLGITEDAINSLVKVKLNQNQMDSLASFILNIGMAGFKRSNVLKQLNQKNYAGAAAAFMGWVKPPEITGRRRLEQALFLQPVKSTPAVSKPTVADPANSDEVVSESIASDPAAGAASSISLKDRIDNYIGEFFRWNDKTADIQEHVNKSSWTKTLIAKITAAVMFVGAAAFQYWYITLIAIVIFVGAVWFFNRKVKEVKE